MNKLEKSDKLVIMLAFARIDVRALSIALGLSAALLGFLATAALVLQGLDGPVFLQLPGFDISWAGSLLGALYFGIFGALLGFTLALLWNLTHIVYITLVVIRATWWRLMAE